MHIVLLCATNRGYRFAQKCFQLGRGHVFTVFSFRETAWEPPYFDDIRSLTQEQGHRFIEARNVAHLNVDDFWKQNLIDLILMVSWRYIVPAHICHRASRGSYVLHDSLLPKYRGFAPTVWSMINGEKETGVTLFHATDDMDAGDIVEQQIVPIADDDTIATIMERVTQTYLRIVERNFLSLLDGCATSYPQNHCDATYTCKWTPADACIDWNLSSRDIHNLIRATSRPYPGAYTFLDSRKLIVWAATIPANPRRYASAVPGRVVESHPNCGVKVLTGDGLIQLKSVQLEGESISKASQLLSSPSKTLGKR